MVVVDELVAESIHGWRPGAIRSTIQAHRPAAASSAADPSTPPAAAEGTDAMELQPCTHASKRACGNRMHQNESAGDGVRATMEC